MERCLHEVLIVCKFHSFSVSKNFRRFGFTLKVSGTGNLLCTLFSEGQMIISKKELLALNLNLLLIRSLTQHQRGRTCLKLGSGNLNRQMNFPNSTKRTDETPQLLDCYRVGGPYWKKNSTQPDYLIRELSVPRRTAAYANLRPEICFACDSF